MKTSKGFAKANYIETMPVGMMFSHKRGSGRVDCIEMNGLRYIYEQRNDGSFNIPLRIEGK